MDRCFTCFKQIFTKNPDNQQEVPSNHQRQQKYREKCTLQKEKQLITKDKTISKDNSLNHFGQKSTHLEQLSHVTSEKIVKNFVVNTVKEKQKSLPQQNQQINKKIPLKKVNQEKQIDIELKTVTGAMHSFKFSNQKTGYQLKEHIYGIVTSLSQNQMDLVYLGTKIENNSKLEEYKISTGTKLTIVQQKISLDQVALNTVDMNGQDGISGEIGVNKMSCGHSVGQVCMTMLIRSLISDNKYEIRCPHKTENQQNCNMIWDYKLCKTIGVFTKEETQQFEKGLSQNWIKQFAKECPNPKCKFTISKGDLKSNRVRCPICKHGDFCYECLGKWVSDNNQFCGSEDCKFLDLQLKNSPWTKIFKLKDQEVEKVFYLPEKRACPHCKIIIQHSTGCKIVKCVACKNSFCWVCLSTKKGNQVWICGTNNFKFCGKIAQAQRLMPVKNV